MYKHILIPTDGSELADKAVEEGIRFAQWAHARVTAFTVTPEYTLPTTGEILSHHAVSIAAHDERSRRMADEILQRIAERARAAGVEFDSDYAQSDQPWQAIVAAAEKHGCDLICMASHGRKGMSALLYGSQAREVLTHSKIPTLVCR